MFLVIDGLDGAGKTTLIAALASRIQRRVGSNVPVVKTREPGGCPLAEDIRTFIFNNKMTAATETMLMFASRTEHLAVKVLPALKLGGVVLCDRFNSSSYVYQVAEKGFDHNVFRKLEEMTLAMLPTRRNTNRPTIVEIILDVSYEVAKSRIDVRGEKNRLDFKTREEFDTRRASYLKRADRENSPYPSHLIDTSTITPAALVDTVMELLTDGMYIPYRDAP